MFLNSRSMRAAATVGLSFAVWLSFGGGRAGVGRGMERSVDVARYANVVSAHSRRYQAFLVHFAAVLAA